MLLRGHSEGGRKVSFPIDKATVTIRNGNGQGGQIAHGNRSNYEHQWEQSNSRLMTVQEQRRRALLRCLRFFCMLPDCNILIHIPGPAQKTAFAVCSLTRVWDRAPSSFIPSLTRCAYFISTPVALKADHNPNIKIQFFANEEESGGWDLSPRLLSQQPPPTSSNSCRTGGPLQTREECGSGGCIC